MRSVSYWNVNIYTWPLYPVVLIEPFELYLHSIISNAPEKFLSQT